MDPKKQKRSQIRPTIVESKEKRKARKRCGRRETSLRGKSWSSCHSRPHCKPHHTTTHKKGRQTSSGAEPPENRPANLFARARQSRAGFIHSWVSSDASGENLEYRSLSSKSWLHRNPVASVPVALRYLSQEKSVLDLSSCSYFVTFPTDARTATLRGTTQPSGEERRFPKFMVGRVQQNRVGSFFVMEQVSLSVSQSVCLSVCLPACVRQGFGKVEG